MTISLKTGNIWDTDAIMIGHGVNTKGAMASGIAVQFREKFPEMHERYMNLCKMLPPARLLGTAAIWTNDFYDGTSKFVVANLFSQENPGADAHYSFVNKSVNQAVIYAEINGFEKIALPQIGCGVGGLNWPTMLALFERFYADSPIELELWTYQRE